MAAGSWAPSLSPHSLAAVNRPLKGGTNASELQEQHLELHTICKELLGRRPVHTLKGHAWRSRPTFSESGLPYTHLLSHSYSLKLQNCHLSLVSWVASRSISCRQLHDVLQVPSQQAELCRPWQQPPLQIIDLKSCGSGKNVFPAQPRLVSSTHLPTNNIPAFHANTLPITVTFRVTHQQSHCHILCVGWPAAGPGTPLLGEEEG